MSNKRLPPPGTIQVWFVQTGEWINRRDHFVSRSRDDAHKWVLDKGLKYCKVSSAHIIWLRGRWYRMNARPVDCVVPTSWVPSDEWMRSSLGLEPDKPDRVYLIEMIPRPKPFTFVQRLRILFTGFPR